MTDEKKNLFIADTKKEILPDGGVKISMITGEGDIRQTKYCVFPGINLFKSLKNRWYLGSEEMERYCADDNCFTLISAPFVSRSQTATHLPFMGEKGMDYLVELKSGLNRKINI